MKVNTCVTEPVSSTTSSESVIHQTSVAADSIPSSAPEIFYGPDGLPLPPGLIAIEEIVEDPPSSTPSQFGVGITLYPSSLEISLLLLEAPVELLRNLLDRKEMFEQPSTSRLCHPTQQWQNFLLSLQQCSSAYHLSQLALNR